MTSGSARWSGLALSISSVVYRGPSGSVCVLPLTFEFTCGSLKSVKIRVKNRDPVPVYQMEHPEIEEDGRMVSPSRCFCRENSTLLRGEAQLWFVLVAKW